MPDMYIYIYIALLNLIDRFFELFYRKYVIKSNIFNHMKTSGSDHIINNILFSFIKKKKFFSPFFLYKKNSPTFNINVFHVWNYFTVSSLQRNIYQYIALHCLKFYSTKLIIISAKKRKKRTSICPTEGKKKK